MTAATSHGRCGHCRSDSETELRICQAHLALHSAHLAMHFVGVVCKPQSQHCSRAEILLVCNSPHTILP